MAGPESNKSLVEAWGMVKKDLGKDLFPGQLVVVPHIQEAAYYNLMVCFTKCQTGVLDKVARVGSFYRLHGHLADLVDVTQTKMAELLFVSEHPVKEEISLPDYSHTWVKDRRTISVELSGLIKLVTNWTINEGSLVLDTGLEELEGVRKLYIISEVVFADRVRVEVTTGEQVLTDQVIQQVPMAFSYMKFPVTTEGVVKGVRGRGDLDREGEFLLMEEEGEVAEQSRKAMLKVSSLLMELTLMWRTPHTPLQFWQFKY